MELLAEFFVQKPLHIMIVAVVFLLSFLLVRQRSMLIAFIAWTVYALWEFIVNVKTPEADIRVDLLLIWPVLFIISFWAVLRWLRSLF